MNKYRNALSDNLDRWEQRHWLADDMQGLEQPWIDPIDALAGGVASLPRGIGNALADVAIDPLVGFAMEQGQVGNISPAGMGLFPKWGKKIAKQGIKAPDQVFDLYNKYQPHQEMFPQHTGGGPLRSNMDYGKSFDLDTTCPRNSNCDDLVQGASKQLERPIYADEAFKAINFLQDKGVKAPCKFCYVDTPRRAWMDGKIKLSEEYGVDPRVWTDNTFREQQLANNPNLASVMDEISKKSRPMMASTPKGYAEYNGQFLTMKPEDIQQYNNRAGFRLNSSTDFKPEHTMDFIQAVTDANAKGLQLHAYTKEPEFIEIFGDSGIKINTSIAASGGMKNGVPDPSSVKMDINNGMDWGDVKKYRNKYDDVGAVFVAQNEGQLQWALDEDWIDYIIPYHASGQKKSQFAGFGAEDFTRVQNPRYKETGKVAKLTREHHKNDPIVMKEYTDKHGIAPQFEKYKDHPNFMKLVVDYARYDTPHKLPDPNKINYKKADEVMSKFVDLGGHNKDVTEDMITEFSNALGD